MYSYHPLLFFSHIFDTLNILEEQIVNLLLTLVFLQHVQLKNNLKKQSSCALVHINVVAASPELSFSYCSNTEVFVLKKSLISADLWGWNFSYFYMKPVTAGLLIGLLSQWAGCCLGVKQQHSAPGSVIPSKSLCCMILGMQFLHL